MISVDNDKLNASLTTSLNAFALSSERKAAEAYLQQIKNTDTKDVFVLLISYISTSFSMINGNSSLVPLTSTIDVSGNVSLTAAAFSQMEANTQLVLSLLADWIQIWWNKFNAEDHLFIRNSIIQQLIVSPSSAFNVANVNATGQSVTVDNSTNILIKSKAIRNKLAVILSNIAKRQYPQNWSTFITDINKLWLNISVFEIQEIFMKTVYILITDCIDPDYSTLLPTLRKSDILSTLRTDLVELLKVSSNYLTFCMNEYMQLVNNKSNTAHNSNKKQTIINTIKTLLQMLQPIFTYLKSDEVYKLQPDLFNILTLLNNLDFQSAALEILVVLTSHKLTNYETFFHILSYICNYSLNLTESNNTSFYELHDMAEALSIQSLYAQALLPFLSYNIAFMLTSSYPPKVCDAM